MAKFDFPFNMFNCLNSWFKQLNTNVEYNFSGEYTTFNHCAIAYSVVRDRAAIDLLRVAAYTLYSTAVQTAIPFRDRVKIALTKKPSR